MLKLCGFPASNYHNKVKLALLEKNLAFEEEIVYPSKDPALYAASPMGKVPFLRTDRGAIAESQVILDYLEDAYPAHPLYPADPYERARVREIITILELHLELVVRRVYGEAFFGGKAPDPVKTEVEKLLVKGLTALASRSDFSAFAAGEAFTAADCAASMHLPGLAFATKVVFGRDMLAELLPAAKAYTKRIGERPTVARVNEERKAGLAGFNDYIAAKSKGGS
jgi:glutathione S-transferase